MTKRVNTRSDGPPLFLAASGSTSLGRRSYTMVLQETAPGNDMHIFHNGQPVVIDRAGAATWLDCRAVYAPLLKGTATGTPVVQPRAPQLRAEPPHSLGRKARVGLRFPPEWPQLFDLSPKKRRMRQD